MNSLSDYLNYMYADMNMPLLKKKHSSLYSYWVIQEDILKKSIENYHTENVFEFIRLIISIDAKLSLLTFLINDTETPHLSEKEIIDIVESEYIDFNKEQCGYKLNESPYRSIIFQTI